MAQYGIFFRRLAAAMYGGSGGGGAGGATLASSTGAGDAAAGDAGVAAAAGTVAAHEAPSSDAGASPPRPSAARRSRERFRRCSGISVNAASADGTRGPLYARPLGHHQASRQANRAPPNGPGRQCERLNSPVLNLPGRRLPPGGNL